ncbi:nucleoside hydrolase [Bacillus canaveralius]|uniref:Nucleoside hydrolase n=1 Tax=Bacillus canaveralius TaxID=1403243 RepID=A0A2N5GJ57_9BACI|nr:nucleoside hydrolase [Bacillus canaveralius]PLR81051.1 nucleoside hydrolase [Bacillus canaveralius]PLR98975.1 nucleoside hydrolase [Bacillus canaveralius]
MAKKNVLFFSDFGVDDFVSAIYAYFNDEINIVGVVGDYGNVPKDFAVRNAVFLQAITGFTDIPVIGGAELPLTGDHPIYYPEIHGLEGLGPISPKFDCFNINLENFHDINKIIAKYKHDIYIVNVGRLSSLAAAFILYPSLMKQVKEFYIMGGAFVVPGNVTPVAEANFFGDPYAANIVINMAPKMIHIIPLDVTSAAIITPDMIDKLHTYYCAVNSQAGMLVKPLVDYYYNFYKNKNPDIPGSPMHDVLTLWALTDAAEMDYIQEPVKIVVDRGEAFGKSIADLRKSADKARFKVHKIAHCFNYSLFVNTFYETMRNHHGRTF